MDDDGWVDNEVAWCCILSANTRNIYTYTQTREMCCRSKRDFCVLCVFRCFVGVELCEADDIKSVKKIRSVSISLLVFERENIDFEIRNALSAL